MDSNYDEYIEICSDAILHNDDVLRIHIIPDYNLTLREFSDYIGLIDKAINDINRMNGASNQAIGKHYSSKICSVDNGSIVIDIILGLLTEVPIKILGKLICQRVMSAISKQKSNQAVNVRIVIKGDNNQIDINFINK